MRKVITMFSVFLRQLLIAKALLSLIAFFLLISTARKCIHKVSGILILIPLLTCVIFFLSSINSYSQSPGVLKGVLQDSITKSNLVFSTITIFNTKDTTIVNYRLSDPEGKFKVPNLPLNSPLRAIITHTGYRIFRLEFELNSDKPVIDFGVIYLNADFTPLDEVLVFSERPPIIVRNDTIEFNASSFKTLPNALVEDLLKKLPGVVISRDGSITVNGKVVNRILVDGKEFFGSDVRIATRNLPANVIERVQVVPDQQELDEILFADKATVGKVINLKLKKGIKKGWFGKVYAGAGSRSRYENGGIVNLFRDTLQISLIGFSNNINKPGFGLDDIKDIGGFGRSGYSSSMISTTGGISLDGISFGATSDGIQKSTGAGFNVNTELSPKQTLNLKYFFGNINSEFDQFRNTHQFLNDTVLDTQSQFVQFTKEYNHKIGASLKWKTDAFSNLTIRSTLSLGKKITKNHSDISSINNFKGLLSESQNYNDERIEYKIVNADIIYRRNFKKRGRAISVNANLSLTNNESEQLTNVESFFYAGASMNSIIDQLRRTNLPNFRFGISATYIEPLSQTASLQISNNTNFLKYEDRLKTFGKDQFTGEFTMLNSILSNSIGRNSYINVTTVGGTWVIKKLRISPKLSFQILSSDNDFENPHIPNQTFQYILPGFSLTWNGIFINYFSSVAEPRITELQSVGDNTNPLYLRFGNPYLKPSITQSIYLTYDKYNTKKLLTYRCLFSSIFYKKGILFQRTVDSVGVQVTSPINANGLYSYRSNISVTKQIRMINKWDLSVTGSFYSDFFRTKVLVNAENSSVNIFSLSPSISYSLNFKNQIEINQEYSLRVNTGRYSNNYFKDNLIVTQHLSSEIILRAIKHVVVESSVEYYHNQGIDVEFKKNTLGWNASISFLLLRDQKGNLKFSVFDILNQNRNINRSITENSISEEQVTILKRFFVASFIYNIRNVKIRKVGGRDRLLLF